jgi:molecular chaperone IbpA
MTNHQLTLRALDIPSIHKFAVGFDSIFDEINRISTQRDNYPPYNVIKHSDDNFVIELAVAGFNEGDIAITLEKQLLTVKGEQVQDLDAKESEYLHRGISARNFVRTFTLADYVEVVTAKVENGILKIDLERKVPDEQKPKTIQIVYGK